MKPMKAFLPLICLCLLLPALFLAGAWAEEVCEHDWTLLITPEYHYGFCKICQAEYPREEHYISCRSDSDDACSLCGAKISEGAVIQNEMHYFELDELSFDLLGHFNVCRSCGKHLNVENHYTNCQHPEGCLVCGAKTADGAVMDEFSHDWHTEYDLEAHWEVCSLCGETRERERHYISCDAQDQESCSYCGAKVSEGAVVERTQHYYYETLKWEYDQDQHWFICYRCGKAVARGVHYALCTNPGFCDVCGIPLDREPLHINNNLEDYSPYDADYHQFLCENCGLIVLESHDFDEEGVCIYCGYAQEAQEETVPAKYALAHVSYDGQTVTGILEQSDGNAPAADLSVRVTFFVTGNYYMATTGEVAADGSFEVEGVGPIEFITVSASGLPYGSQDRSILDATGLVIE